MLAYHHDGLEVDSCPECFGLWFDREELKELSQRLEENGSSRTEMAHPRQSDRLCPACRKALVESSLGEVLVDFCPHCRGIWLDQGELNRAVEQYRKGQRGNLVVLNQIAEGLRAARANQ